MSANSMFWIALTIIGISFGAVNPAICQTVPSSTQPSDPDGQPIPKSGNPVSEGGDTDTDHSAWVFATGGAVRSSPAIGADGTVYVGSDDRKLYAVNGETGDKKWEFRTGAGDVNRHFATPCRGMLPREFAALVGERLQLGEYQVPLGSPGRVGRTHDRERVRNLEELLATVRFQFDGVDD